MAEASTHATDPIAAHLSDVMYPDVLIYCAKAEEKLDALKTIQSLAPHDAYTVLCNADTNSVSLGGAQVVYGDLVVRSQSAVRPPLLAGRHFVPAETEPGDTVSAALTGHGPASSSDARSDTGSRTGNSAAGGRLTAATSIRWVLCSGARQGPECGAAGIAAVLARLHPRAVGMLGMCAGRQSVFKLGDVVCAGAATHIYEGKKNHGDVFMKDSRKMNDAQAENLGRAAEHNACQFADMLAPAGRRVKYAEFASGPVVDEGGSMWKEMLDRRCDAYDMEASALFTAVEQYRALFDRPISNLGVVKGVMDFGTAASRGGTELPKLPNGEHDTQLIDFMVDTYKEYCPSKSHLASLAIHNATLTFFFGVLPAYCQAASISPYHITLGAQYAAALQANTMANAALKELGTALEEHLKTAQAGASFFVGPVLVTNAGRYECKPTFSLDLAKEVIHRSDLIADEKKEALIAQLSTATANAPLALKQRKFSAKEAAPRASEEEGLRVMRAWPV